MTISCGPFSSQNQPLRCTFPECNCDRCQKSRTEKNTLNCDFKDNPCSRFLAKGKTEASNLSGHFSKEKSYSDSGLASLLAHFHYDFEPENVFSVLFDVIGTIAFLIMATFTFWLVVTIYVWRLIVTVYNAGRKTQIYTLAVFTLILICIVFHAITGHKAKSMREVKPVYIAQEPLPTSTPPNFDQDSSKVIATSASTENFKKVCKQKCKKSSAEKNQISDCHLKDLKVREKGGTECGKVKKQASESLCDLCAKKFGKSSSQISLTEEEIKKIYYNYNLASVPMEWKSPPEPIVFIVDYLQSLFGPTENSETPD